jgi:hypothetical protein
LIRLGDLVADTAAGDASGRALERERERRPGMGVFVSL